MISLVPRPFHRPVLIACSMKKWRGKAWYHLSREWRQCLHRWTEGGRGHWSHFADAFFVFNQERYAFRFANVQKSSAWGRNYKIRPLACSFDGGSLHLDRHWRHSRDKWYQAFPLRFCILQAIKNWTVGRPGNEAKLWSLMLALQWPHKVHPDFQLWSLI